MQLTQQKGIVPQDFPFDLFVTNINGYPPHWHGEIELVYVLDKPSDEVIVKYNWDEGLWDQATWGP